MRAVILNDGRFILEEGNAPYFIAKEDFLNFLADREALKIFIENTPCKMRAISPITEESIINAITIELENNQERLGFYEYYGT